MSSMACLKALGRLLVEGRDPDIADVVVFDTPTRRADVDGVA